ncbi:DUF4407 domain-containing protein [Stappia stellulata]|uniref:DUF4407 domain-containing protein n=1 Tax=Stappia stellulata TaxID=71235 RepID=UPI001CD2AA92|nr:DUF4407 domain-containing protein [Stappia stellulata]MCA1241463.1 DUF4407 domain-containing protein [Stappia stellulata]
MPNQHTDLSTAPTRRERGPAMGFTAAILATTAVCSGGMMALGLPNILSGDGLWLAAKVSLVTVAATAIAFAVNKFAIERGAPLTVIGYRSAGAVSLASMLAVGGTMFAATYPGLVHKDVAFLALQSHGEALSAGIAARNAAAGRAARIMPVVDAGVADLSRTLECEIRASCISGRGSGGYGPVARAIEEKLGRAQGVAGEMARGRSARTQALKELTGLIADYQSVLSDTTREIAARRVALKTIDARLRQRAIDLREALPLALIRAYAADLEAGASIPGRTEATRRLSAVLARHGAALREVLSTAETEAAAFPPFPGRTGVSATFGHIPHFLPVAAVAALVELVLPLTLWIYTLLTLSWRSYRRERPRPRPATRVDLMAEFYADDARDDPAPADDRTDAGAPHRPRRRDRSDPRANGRWRDPGHRPNGGTR